MSAKHERIAALEGALALLERAAKKIIEGSGGAAAVNRVMEARDELEKKVRGLKIKR